MKKLIMLISAVMIILALNVNCFAYMKIDELWYENSLTEKDTQKVHFDVKYKSRNELKNLQPDVDCFAMFLITNEIKYINGNPMVKLRDVVNAINGKIEYNPYNKQTKIYFWDKNSNENKRLCTRSFALIPGSEEITISRGKTINDLDYYSYKAKFLPMILDGSLYILADDLGVVLEWPRSKINNDYDSSNIKSYTTIFNKNLYCYIARNRN